MLKQNCTSEVKEVGYFAICQSNIFPGVRNKIQGAVRSFNLSGFCAQAHIVEGAGLESAIRLCISIIKAKENNLIIRLSPVSAILLFFAILIARVKRKRITVDVPTPRRTCLREVWASEESRLSVFIKATMTVCAGGWALTPAHTVLQYAPESRWFEFGVKSKTKLIGNGIDVHSIKANRRSSSSDELVFISVATMDYWHGFDRVLNGLYCYYESDWHIPVKYILVGGGSEIKKLKNMVSCLGLNDVVFFEGVRQGADLDDIYKRANIGVGSLALHRKGLDIASSLKEREYCAKGLPFITTGFDPDFSCCEWFRFAVKLNDDPIDIFNVIDWYEDCRSEFDFSEIRRFAEYKLDYSVKIGDFFCD